MTWPTSTPNFWPTVRSRFWADWAKGLNLSVELIPTVRFAENDQGRCFWWSVSTCMISDKNASPIYLLRHKDQKIESLVCQLCPGERGLPNAHLFAFRCEPWKQVFFGENFFLFTRHLAALRHFFFFFQSVNILGKRKASQPSKLLGKCNSLPPPLCWEFAGGVLVLDNFLSEFVFPTKD